MPQPFSQCSIRISVELFRRNDFTVCVRCKANGLLERFQKGETVLGLTLANEITEELECLNISLRRRTRSIVGMLAAVECVKSSPQEN